MGTKTLKFLNSSVWFDGCFFGFNRKQDFETVYGKFMGTKCVRIVEIM